jgi:D-mannonate dehydratase
MCAKENATWSQPQSENERQQSVNDFVCCILYHPGAALWHLSIIEVLAAFICKIGNVDVASPDNERQQSINRPSTERQQSIKEHQQSVNRASTIFGVASS